jgi:hypothetical protein
VTAYSVVGTVAGGATGYGAGFGTGLYTSGGDFSYANQMGSVMSGVGAQIGSVAGMAGGGWAAYSSQMAKAATGLASKEAVKTAAGESAKNGTYSVYEGLDAAGKTRYVGITGRDATIRFGEHLNSGTARSLLDYRAIDGATSLSKTQARIWEQTLINQYGLQKNSGMLLNKINSIAPEYWWQYGIKP